MRRISAMSSSFIKCLFCTYLHLIESINFLLSVYETHSLTELSVIVSREFSLELTRKQSSEKGPKLLVCMFKFHFNEVLQFH